MTPSDEARRDATPQASQEHSGGPGWTGAVGAPTRLLLLRHGQTALSVDRRYSGRGNPPLTDLGRRQADAAARRLAGVDVAAVISSPLARATATAQAVADVHQLPVVVEEGLIETDFGAWEGLTFAEALAHDPDLHRRWRSDVSVSPPGGESFDEVAVRVARARDALVAAHPASTIVVVSHVTPIKLMLQQALGVGPSLLYRLHLDLASLSIAEHYPDGGTSVRGVNDICHLDG